MLQPFNIFTTFLGVLLYIMLYKVPLSFEFVDKILKCDQTKERYLASFYCLLWL